MSIYWEAFTPWSSLAGGVLIGLAAALMVVLLGRIAGISGILGGLLQKATWGSVRQWGWRAAFVAGMLLAPLLWQMFAPLPAMQMPSNPMLIISAGLLVGFGTRLGSGCTSGHGVCGLSRLSIRSLAATLMFMATGVATVFIMRHVVA
ncbi:YeeE/YedE family protein [Comamonas kerstersii]|uniref:YeeE/YedE n=1 Tax=Comamonas kerstersii TaxID=225992 RepID=A0A0W7YWT9_9BURK|nr:YeeE/YedE family protein [Comamonas kerstersii]AQZ99463.1 YeeE/YedE [Comamonas kerstersii]KAB0587285.1 YeeE/YedE family protein [Comamonas kerstersii]KUF39607.1 YeeE/YedE [Comamonas kerstersii]OOH87807.1 YeeE/YedE [Comamonas kerstersii]OOH94767.1 YeeE/YedE [Comamonas kerstersii]